MVRSMTGFGKGIAEGENREVTVELKTVNHRYLDINLRMPRVFSVCEDEFRKRIQSSTARGHVDVYIVYQNNAQNQLTVTLNEPVAEAYKSAFQSLSEKFQVENNPDLAILSAIDNIFIIQESDDEEVLERLLFSALDQALLVLSEMKEKEGNFLARDILKRCNNVEEMIESIEKRSPVVVDEYRKKLEQRLKELLKNTDLDDTRFQTEIAYFADRSNITEEIIRLRSHLKQMKDTIANGGSIGRKLEFIVQEMNRETNTIGSKSADVLISSYVVELKSELEKIREQVQNIE